MRFKILLSLIAFVATAALAQPAAHADGPRFKFPVNYYKIEEPTYPRSSYVPPVASTVRAGSTPSGSTMLGIPLANIKRAAVPAHVTPLMQPNVMAQFTPPSFNTAFGRPGALPMTANPSLKSVSIQTPAVKSQKSVSAPKTFSHSQNGFPKMVKRTRPSNPANAIARSNQIKNYNTGFEAGPTNPSVFGSGVNIEQRVGGKIIRK